MKFINRHTYTNDTSPSLSRRVFRSDKADWYHCSFHHWSWIPISPPRHLWASGSTHSDEKQIRSTRWAKREVCYTYIDGENINCGRRIDEQRWTAKFAELVSRWFVSESVFWETFWALGYDSCGSRLVDLKVYYQLRQPMARDVRNTLMMYPFFEQIEQLHFTTWVGRLSRGRGSVTVYRTVPQWQFPK